MPMFEKQLGKLNQKTLLACYLSFHVEWECFSLLIATQTHAHF